MFEKDEADKVARNREGGRGWSYGDKKCSDRETESDREGGREKERMLLMHRRAGAHSSDSDGCPPGLL
jgi:hypothetical protein